MSNEKAPTELNWVNARARCNLYEMFKALELGVRTDVEAAQALVSKHAHTVFSVAMSGNKRFSVSRIDDPLVSIVTGSVDFVREHDRIAVSMTKENETKPLFEASLTLNNEGECKLKVGGVELEQWQVRRKALEGLFF